MIVSLSDKSVTALTESEVVVELRRVRAFLDEITECDAHDFDGGLSAAICDAECGCRRARKREKALVLRLMRPVTKD